MWAEGRLKKLRKTAGPVSPKNGPRMVFGGGEVTWRNVAPGHVLAIKQARFAKNMGVGGGACLKNLPKNIGKTCSNA